MKILTLAFLTFSLLSSKAQSNSFDFKYDNNGIDVINTYDNTFRRKYIQGDTLIRFKLTSEDRKAISGYADKLQVRKIKSPIKTKDCDAISFPAYFYEMKFFDPNGELVKLDWGNNLCVDDTIKKLETFLDKAVRLIMSKKEFQGLKDSDIISL